MTYELVDATRREASANEYRNTRTGEFEVLRSYGAYRIQESFLMPDGDVLFLGYGESCAYKHVIGVYGRSLGVYRYDAEDARQCYAQKIAESLGLVVVKPGEKVVTPEQQEEASGLVHEIKGAYDQWYNLPDDVEAAEIGDRVADNAEALSKFLQKIGLLSRPVPESWEPVL
ncbi:hypothetical protein ACWEDZ_02860 [Streptomyces sp. NPDC005047]